MSMVSAFLHNAVYRVAQGFALAGGAVLAGVAGLTCLSIIGRSLNSWGHADWLQTVAPPVAGLLQSVGPITGDYELVEAGIAFAVAAFLPWCHLNRSHASVDFVVERMPPPFRTGLTALWQVILTGTYALLAWRLTVGAGDKWRYGETSLLLQFPVWWAYAACAVALWAAFAVGLASLLAHDATGRHSDRSPT